MDEEWRSHINDVDGDIEKIYVAVGLNIAAHRLISSDKYTPGREASYNLSAGNRNFWFKLAECCSVPSDDSLVVVIDVIGSDQISGDITFICATIHYAACPNHLHQPHRSIPFPTRTKAEQAILHPPQDISIMDWLN
jgi:hypothetical protein